MRPTSDSTTELYTFGTANLDWFIACCGDHRWKLQSRRGTNCNQRVEHLWCRDCGKRIVRTWRNLPKQGRPDYERPA